MDSLSAGTVNLLNQEDLSTIYGYPATFAPPIMDSWVPGDRLAPESVIGLLRNQ